MVMSVARLEELNRMKEKTHTINELAKVLTKNAVYEQAAGANDDVVKGMLLAASFVTDYAGGLLIELQNQPEIAQLLNSEPQVEGRG